ncbi:hypothetical protein FGG08_001650 [Glutinoglossum americanum]|uniref:Uncharacterized protein n=1 Tax=Glutinoglossum americanum TaxID=1670608 RepID=A0A9P8L566_9PEZI|nr:hypothetical protein FGG08_001650 [Glutinoglossum americanum]
MKVSGTVILSGLLAVAVQAVPQATETSAAPVPTHTPTPQEICLGKCSPSDVDCQAACITVPAPNQSMANETHDCAAKCNQGNGSPSDTEAYSNCVQGCISSYFYSTGGSAATAKPNASGSASAGSAAATGTGTGAATGTGKGSVATGSNSGSASATGTESAKATGAANSMQVGASFAGVAGIMAAIFAL